MHKKFLTGFLLGAHFKNIEVEGRGVNAGASYSAFDKNSNFGVLFWFGFTFFQTIGFELIGDYGISNLLQNPELKTTTAGANAILYINMEKFLNR